MKILCTGNRNFGVAKALAEILPYTEFVSRENGFDLCTSAGQEQFSQLSLNFDKIIINSALWKFNQTILLDKTWKNCVENNHFPHIICISSTTDRSKSGKVWLYNAEKKALRDYCNSLGLASVWDRGPKITLISFGTLTNNQHKHPTRKVMNINQAAEYIKWVIDQPKNLAINEISIDPMQGQIWHE